MRDLTVTERKALEFRISSASFVVRGARLTRDPRLAVAMAARDDAICPLLPWRSRAHSSEL